MVRDGRWKLSVCLNPRINDGALYDLDADPCELTNLYEVPGHEETVQTLLGLIAEHLEHSHKVGGVMDGRRPDGNIDSVSR
jgi:hypothetical protein